MENFLEFQAHLVNDLVALSEILFGVVTGELLPGAADGESLLVEKTAYLAHHDHVMALIVSTITPPLYGLELWELLLPIAQDMGLDPTELTHFANGEIALSRDRGELAAAVVVIVHFQHTLQPATSISGRGEK